MRRCFGVPLVNPWLSPTVRDIQADSRALELRNAMTVEGDESDEAGICVDDIPEGQVVFVGPCLPHRKPHLVQDFEWAVSVLDRVNNTLPAREAWRSHLQ